MIRLGTRESRLAMAQASVVKSKLEEMKYQVKIVGSRSIGDIDQKSQLSTFRGRGIFSSKLEELLISGDIDIAVHSLKDLPVSLNENFEIRAYIQMNSRGDSLIINSDKLLGIDPIKLKKGTTIATGSIRRQAQLSANFPEINVVDIRGNIDTRISKLHSPYIDGLVVASAVFDRINVSLPDNYKIIDLPIDRFPGAPAQGIIAVETLKGAYEDLSFLNDLKTQKIAEFERDILGQLSGSCELGLGLTLDYNKKYSAYLSTVNLDSSWAQISIYNSEIKNNDLNELKQTITNIVPKTNNIENNNRVLIATDPETSMPYKALLSNVGYDVFQLQVFNYYTIYENLTKAIDLWRECEWLVISSKRAVEFCKILNSQYPRTDIRVAVVGRNTALHMRDAGFPVHIIAKNMNTLKKWLDYARSDHPGDILYLSGKHIISLPAEDSHRIIAYTAELRQLSFPIPVDVVVCFSPRSARHIYNNNINSKLWIAIGKTTGKALSELGVNYAIAEDATPLGVLNVLNKKSE